MAILEGNTGIVAAGKEARAKAVAKSKQVTSDKKIAAEYRVDPIDKMIRDIDRAGKRLSGQESTGGVKETGRGMGDTFNPAKDFQVKRPNYFSPGGGAFDERNNVEVASSDLSSLRSDDTSESTFGKSFTEQASANLADASIYQKKDNNIYRPSDNAYEKLKEFTKPIIEKESYFDQSETDKYFFTGDKYDDAVNFFTRKEPGSFQERKDDYVRQNIKYGTDADGNPTALSSSPLNEGQPLNISTEKLKSFLVKDAKEDQAYKDKMQYESINRSMEADQALAVTKSLEDNYGFDPRKYIKPDVPPNTRINEETGLQEIPKYFQKPNPLVDPKNKNYLGDNAVPESMKAGYKPSSEIASMPSMTISEEGRKIAELNKTPKVEVKQPNVLDRTMNFIGNVTNKVLGIQDAGASQLGPVNVKTKATTAPVGGYNISPEGKVKALQNRIEAGIKSTGIPNNVAVQGGAMSQEARDQALQNRINAGIASTGIPSGMATQGGVTTQAAIDAGIKARQQREAAIKMRDDKVQKIIDKNPRLTRGADGSIKAVQKTRAEAGVSARTAQGNRARVKNNAKARAQAAAAKRKLSGTSISKAKAANKAKMKAAAKKRHAAFKKRRALKKKKKKKN